VSGVRRGGGIGVIAVVGALAFLIWGAGGAAAGPRASTAAVATYHLRLGDTVSLKGTTIECVVQKQNGIINFACLKGGLSSPMQGSYAVGIADKGVDIAQVSGDSAKLLKVVAEPAVGGAAFPTPTRSSQHFDIAPTAGLLIGGTHVFCAVEFAVGVRNVTCGLSSLALRLQFPAGSLIASESETFALLGKSEAHGQFQNVSLKTQP
jgi:hypothetical protein